MIQKILLLLLLFPMAMVYGQDEERRLLLGKVMYRNTSVSNENVINSTAETATITNSDGQFAINVKVGDELVFTAVNYQLEIVTITQEILDNNRLVVEVNEKVTELDEVIVTPEDQERFLKLRNEEFKEYEYEIDRGTEVENVAMSDADRGMRDGINFVNIFRAIFKSNPEQVEEGPKLLLSEVLRQVYDDEFFVRDLNIPQDKIGAFLLFCDQQMPAQQLLKKENEFQLIDALVNNSKLFLASVDDQ